MKPSVLSLYSPTMGDSPQSGHMFGHRFSHRSSHGGLSPSKENWSYLCKVSGATDSVFSLYSPTGGTPPGPVTCLVTGLVMGGVLPQRKLILPLQGLRSNWQWSQLSSPYIVLLWGTPPRSSHMFGHRFSNRSSHGGLPPFTSHYITSHMISTKATHMGAN